MPPSSRLRHHLQRVELADSLTRAPAAEEARAALNRAQIGETGKLAAIALGAIGLVGAALLSIDTTESTSKTKSAASTKVKVRPSIKI